MNYRFGAKGLISCLTRLRFTRGKVKNSSHLKYYPPKEKPITRGQISFINVILGRTQYADQTAAKYVSQIIRLGFTRDEVEQCLKDE